MEYFRGQRDFNHGSKPKIGVLLANLGTPDAPTAQALRPYLKQFLSDPRVIELPRWKWLPILHLFVLTFRPRRSAKLYQKIWTEKGSPLMVYTKAQHAALQQRFEKINASGQYANDVIFEIGMRYGNPSIESGLEKLRKAGAERLLVLPLFPQYSSTTVGAVFDAVADVLKGWRWIPEFRMISSYGDRPRYIEALAAKVNAFWEKGGRPEKLLISFHGIPERYFLGGDPYHCHCLKTARLLAERLGLPKESYGVGFQSLFGKEKWLTPYTNLTLIEWAKAGINRVDVVAPAFTSDCLETVEELGEEYRHEFLEAEPKGVAREYRYIPALNDDNGFIDTLVELVQENIQGWEGAGRQPQQTASLYQIGEAAKRANS